MKKKLIIVGDSAFAEVAYEYFTHDSDYTVVAFAVESAYKKNHSLFGLPIVNFEELEGLYPPEDHYFFVAIIYSQLNRLRTRLYLSLKTRGYLPASYISSRAFVWKNAKLGEHCFIFEDNTVQPFVEMGNNVILWSGNHIGHHSTIADHCFISSHVVISGFCTIGENCFIGVNSTIANNINVGKDCLIGAAAVILKSIPEDKIVRGNGCEAAGSARRFYKIKEAG